MKETERMKKAFELYNSLGAERSYEKVAYYMGVTPRSVETWGSEFKWQERLKKKEEEQKERYKKEYEELAETQLKIKLLMAQKYLESIEKRSISDYKEYLGVVGTEVNLSSLGIAESVEDQTACALSNTAPSVYIVKPDGVKDD